MPLPIASLNLVRAAVLEERMAEEAPWSLSSLAGRFSELSGPGSLSLASRLVVEAQAKGEPACWIAAGPASFFPPDMAAAGVVLEALPVVRADGALAAAHAADRLLRSGAFGLVVVDLDSGLQGEARRIGASREARLAALALRHDTALLWLGGGRGAAAAAVSMRVQARRERLGGLRYRCELRALKDKRRAALWREEELRRGPAGLR